MRILIWRDESLERVDDVDDLDDEFDDNDHDEHEHNHHQSLPKSLFKIPTVYSTPFGQVSSTDDTNILFERDMFTGHTNFYIDSESAIKIMEVPGVDGLRLISPYSFAVCVGMCFFFGDVLTDIEEVLTVDKIDETPEINQETVKSIISNNFEIITSIHEEFKEHEFWFVYVLPNNTTIREIFESKEAMVARKDFYIECSHLTNGILLSSDDVS